MTPYEEFLPKMKEKQHIIKIFITTIIPPWYYLITTTTLIYKL